MKTKPAIWKRGTAYYGVARRRRVLNGEGKKEKRRGKWKKWKKGNKLKREQRTSDNLNMYINNLPVA